MMDEKTYNGCVEKGTFAENLFLKFMLEDGYEFIAGDVNRETINPDYFEECFPCRFIPSNERYGSRLAFVASSGQEFVFIMPDYLLSYSKNKERYLFDVKSRRKNNLMESKHKLISYYGVSKYTGLECFISLVIWDEKSKGYNIYVDNVNRYVSNDELRRFELGDRFSEDVYFDLKKMRKFNKYPIRI